MGQLWTKILSSSWQSLDPKASKDRNYGRISAIRFTQLPSLAELPVVNTNTNEFPNCPFFWSRLIESFTRGNLTYSSDKLRALQGIANAIKLTRYWKFAPEDVWTLPRGSMLCKPEESRATSWSRASLNEACEILKRYSLVSNSPSIAFLTAWTLY
jgi:hypothetical protein